MDELIQDNKIGRVDLRLAFSVDEAAKFIGVCPDTIRRWIREKKIRKLPMRHCRISAVELNRFLAEGS